MHLLFHQKRNRIQVSPQAWGMTVALLGLCLLYQPIRTHAADIDLLINDDGTITTSSNSDIAVTSELYHGWRSDILFATLTSRFQYNADQFSISVQSAHVPLNAIDPKLYTVHGANNALISSSDSQRVWQVVTSPGGQVTLVADTAPNTFSLSPFWRIMTLLGHLNDTQWFILAGALPLLTMLYLIYRTSARPHGTPDNKIDPELLHASPAALTVLWRGFVSRRAIAATMVDLAIRGHLQILVRDNTIILYKRESHDSLREHEIKLLKRWFGSQLNSNLATLQQELKKEVISQHSQEVNLAIYQEIERYGWYTPSPLITHWKFLLITFGLTIIWSLGFLLTYIFIPSASSLLWFWGGILIVIGLFYTFLPSLAHRNQAGQTAITNLVSAKTRLAVASPIHPNSSEFEGWQDLLPLAMILGVGPKWLVRWHNINFQQPSWLLTIEPIRTFDEFLVHIDPVLKIASDSIRDKILPAYL